MGTFLQTCWIDTNETGSRCKAWRNAVQESSTQETVSDGVVSGTATALTVCRKILQNGSDPERSFAEWGKELSVKREDRACNEMHTRINIFHQAACYDQLDLGALVCMELVSRRLQQFTEAFAHGADAPNWPVQNTSLAAVPLLSWWLRRCDRTLIVKIERRRSLSTCERGRKHTWSTI